MSYSAQEIDSIEQHLRKLNALEFAPNVAMLDRLRAGLGDAEDVAFFQHETIEAALLQGGMGAREAHLRTLADQQIAYEPGYEAALYHPSVVSRYPDCFNPAVLRRGRS